MSKTKVVYLGKIFVLKTGKVYKKRCCRKWKGGKTDTRIPNKSVQNSGHCRQVVIAQK